MIHYDPQIIKSSEYQRQLRELVHVLMNDLGLNCRTVAMLMGVHRATFWTWFNSARPSNYLVVCKITNWVVDMWPDNGPLPEAFCGKVFFNNK